MSINIDTGKEQSTRRRFFPVAVLIVAALSCYMYLIANTQRVDFEPLAGPIINPLMGWAPWATIEESSQPHTLVYADLTWREFEPQEGTYDFASFEKKQQLARWRKEGKRVIFRFIADKPENAPHIDIPDWLYEKIDGSGEYYDNEYGMGFSPNYSHPALIESHRNVIQALGEQYGRDGFFAFVELGSLGHWGEWHTHSQISPLPSADIINLYVHQYVVAFPGTHLLMRRPFAIARALDLGLYNDMTADAAQTGVWLDWIEHGDMSHSQETYGLAAMPTGWQTAPVGGEQASSLSHAQVYGTDLEQTLLLLQRSHTSFIGPNSPYDVEYQDPLQDGIDRVMATIGYRIYVDHVELPRKVRFGKSIRIKCTLSNSGIAPLYYNWPAQLYLLSEAGEILAVHSIELDFRNLLPGQPHNFIARLPVAGLKNGNYTVGMAILDPLTGQPAVQFANANPRGDRIQVLGSFEIRWLLNREQDFRPAP